MNEPKKMTEHEYFMDDLKYAATITTIHVGVLVAIWGTAHGATWLVRRLRNNKK